MPLIMLMAAASFAGSAPYASQCRRASADCPRVSSLLGQREGYGRHASGGLGGSFVTVTSSADDGPGSLREALAEAGGRPVWITFAKDMAIAQTSQYRVPSNVTIDGRGHHVSLLDYGLGLYGVRNVIVTHLTIDGESRTFSQAFNIAKFSKDIWGDHLDLSRFNDRLIDVKEGSTDITLSWIKFHDDNKVMLLNNYIQKNMFADYDRDSQSRVTMHHSYFYDTVQRNPRAVFGTFHIFNNVVENWDFYGMAFSLEARATVEGNIFVNHYNRPCWEPDHFATKEGTDSSSCRAALTAPNKAIMENGQIDKKKYDETNAQFHYSHDWRAFMRERDNLFLGDASAKDLGPYREDQVPPPPYCYTYDKADEQLLAKIRQQAGNTPYEGDQVAATCQATD